MKKLFALLLTVIIVVYAFPLVVSAAEQPLEFYAGVKEGTDAPAMDGKVEKDEYAVAIEKLNPNDPNGEYYKYLAYTNLAGGDVEPSGNSNTISFSIYMSIDSEYLYVAAVEEDYPDSTWQGEPHVDNKAVTFIDFTLPSGNAFRCRLVSSSGAFDGFCENIEGNNVIPEESQRAITNLLDGDKRYITVEMKIKIADIEALVGEKLPNTVYFAALSRFDGDELRSYDDVVFQALHKDAHLGGMASWIGGTLLRKCHTLHLTEEGKCAHRGMSGEKIDQRGHKLICECGYTEKAEHIWDDGEVTREPDADIDGEIVYSCEGCDATKIERLAIADDSSDGAPTDTPTDTPDDNKTDDEAKAGCKASVSAAGLALVATLGLGVTVISKKKN